MTRIVAPGGPSNAGRRFIGAITLIAACFAIMSGNVLAEKADRDKPMNLEADRVSVDDAKQIATFEGNVVLTQGTMVIRGDRMVVRQDNEGFKSGTTWGNLAYFRQKRDGFDEFIEGWAERIEYDGRADKVQMFNRASMKRAQDEVRGLGRARGRQPEPFADPAVAVLHALTRNRQRLHVESMEAARIDRELDSRGTRCR